MSRRPTSARSCAGCSQTATATAPPNTSCATAWARRHRPSRHIVTSANGQPAIAWYILDPTGGGYKAASIEVLDLTSDKVKHITAFADAGFFAAFGLPGALPA
jgi:hypothetical protein